MGSRRAARAGSRPASIGEAGTDTMAERRPNIVFVFSDQQHWQAVGHRDATFTTPSIDCLAEQSVVFDNAFCTTPQCSPSRSSILTGLYPTRTGVLGNIGAAGGTPLQMPTIGPALQRGGYATGYFGKWHLGHEAVGTAGWDEDRGVTDGAKLNDEESTRRAVDFIHRRARDAEQPMALFFSINDPHDICKWPRNAPAVTPGDLSLPPTCRPGALDDRAPVQRQFLLEDQQRMPASAAEELYRNYRMCYRDCVAKCDGFLGQVMDALRETTTLDDTLLVYTSDHGDMDGHHGLVFKGPFMYEQMIRVPAYVRLPRAWGGPVHRVERFHTVNVDWAPTLLEAAGLDATPGDGQSLVGLLRGGAAPKRDFTVAEYYSKQKWVNPIRSIRTADAKLVWYADGWEEMYDLRRDPTESRNAIHDADIQPVRRKLAQWLDQWIVSRGDPFRSLKPTRINGEAIG